MLAPIVDGQYIINKQAINAELKVLTNYKTRTRAVLNRPGDIRRIKGKGKKPQNS